VRKRNDKNITKNGATCGGGPRPSPWVGGYHEDHAPSERFRNAILQSPAWVPKPVPVPTRTRWVWVRVWVHCGGYRYGPGTVLVGTGLDWVQEVIPVSTVEFCCFEFARAYCISSLVFNSFRNAAVSTMVTAHAMRPPDACVPSTGNENQLWWQQ